MLLWFHYLFISPLEFLMRLVLEWGYSLTHSWGWSLILLSFAASATILPIDRWAERGREAQRALRRSMSRHEAMLRACFRGQERFALLSALRRLRGDNLLLALRAGVGLLAPIPFFIAAWHLLSAWTPFSGRGFGLLADLSAPDGLLRLGGVEINILPFVMTAANLLAAFVYARDLARRDRFQIYGIALLFLVLLYAAPSALVLYWTLNNLFSLGKSLVVQWRRQAVRRQIGCDHRPTSRKAAGALPRLACAFTRSFGVGAVFWTYTATAALQRNHDQFGGELRFAIWRLAGQCALTALCAGLALFALSPPSSRRKLSWNPLVLAACLSALFLFQARFFNTGLSAAGGRFPFELWDGAGSLFFALWTLGLFGIGRFHDRMVGMSRVMGRGLLDRLDRRRRGSGGKPEKPPAPSSRDTFVVACLMGATCGLFLWYFIPFCTYFRNPNEFGFNGWELFWQAAPWCLMTVLAASLLFHASTRFLPSECVRLPWKGSADTGGQANILHAAALAGLFLLYLEGTLLSWNLPQLAGEEELINSNYRLAVDTIIWLDFLLIGLWFWRKISRNCFVLLSFFALLLCATSIDFYRDSREKIDIDRFEGIKGLSMVDKETLFHKLCFSKSRNALVLLVDTLDTLSFEKMVETYPDIERVFDGFWLFRENLGTGGLTAVALPQILTGHIMDDGESLNDLTREALVGGRSMAADALAHGRKVFIDKGTSFSMSDENADLSGPRRNRRLAVAENFHKFAFRFYPYWGKRMSVGLVNYRHRETDAFATAGDDPNKMKFNRLIRRMGTTCDQDVLQFIHFEGVHPPFVKGSIIEAAHEYFLDFAKFLDALKNFGLFDNATIVVMADHGFYGDDFRSLFPERRGTQPTRYFPLLMVKTPDSSGPMVVREDLTSSACVRGLLARFYEQGARNDVMEAFLAGLPDVRHVYEPETGRREARGVFSTMEFRKAEGGKRRPPDAIRRGIWHGN